MEERKTITIYDDDLMERFTLTPEQIEMVSHGDPYVKALDTQDAYDQLLATLTSKANEYNMHLKSKICSSTTDKLKIELEWYDNNNNIVFKGSRTIVDEHLLNWFFT